MTINPKFSLVLALVMASALIAPGFAQTPAAHLKLADGQTTGRKLETAYFAGGCFWGVEERFRQVHGVKATTVGYSGGTAKDPTYEQVCSGKTGHTETVKVEFDPSVVTYKQLLRVFWEAHDPTTLNSQGPDIGTNYRSAIFYATEDQKSQALASKNDFQRLCSRPIVTEIAPETNFYDAESYHQQYLEKHGLAVCH